MLTALIIVSIAFVLLFILFLRYVNLHKDDVEYHSDMWKDMREDEEKHHEYVTRCHVQKALQYAYGISGDIFHGFSEIVQKDNEYVELIKRLGEYARGMYLYEIPLSCLKHSVFADENYQFPQLDKEQSRELWGFLKDIYNEKRPPYAIFELISGLVYGHSFERAMVMAEQCGKGEKSKS